MSTQTKIDVYVWRWKDLVTTRYVDIETYNRLDKLLNDLLFKL